MNIHNTATLLSLLVALAAVTACSGGDDAAPPGGGGGGVAGDAGAAPSRRDVDCATINRESLAGVKKHFSESATVVPGWGRTREALQVLPTGAELCGTIVMGEDKPGVLVSSLIRSPLYGAELRALYDAAAVKAGCSFDNDLSRQGQTLVSWDCRHEGGPRVDVATVTTDTAYAFFSWGSIGE